MMALYIVSEPCWSKKGIPGEKDHSTDYQNHQSEEDVTKGRGDIGVGG
jgi:hypothetical protein